MALVNTSKIRKSEPTSEWEVRGRFNFSSDGSSRTSVKTVVYVSAVDAADAARRAVEMMGVGAEIKRVQEIYNDPNKGDDE